MGRRDVPAPVAAVESRLAFPWWCYPLATAAAVVFALVVWWGNSHEAPPPATAANVAVGVSPSYLQDVAELQASFGIDVPSEDSQVAAADDELTNIFLQATENTW